MLRSLRLRLVIFLLVPVLVAGGLALGLTTRSVTSYERAQTQQRLSNFALILLSTTQFQGFRQFIRLGFYN